ncbi:DUF397 domain-containing protein [Micromonospora rifamycinica]|uniref:DUF397 domain-containing protein n=1 Tax=Micromonospora rifamycinica TaxID=291594 RepID=UPI003413D124
MADFDEAVWRKSSHSSAEGNCVEVASSLPGGLGVRDSKDVAGPILVFSRKSWRKFLSAVRQPD